MTKKLEDLFDLPSQADIEPDVVETIAEDRQIIQALDESIDKIDAALPTVRNIESSDAELDDIAKRATDTFEELMSLGMNVEPRHGAEIFNTAGTMLNTALSAKNAKMVNKLKIVQLQLQKARLDFQKEKAAEEGPAEGEAETLDRNALLAQIIEMNKKQDSDK